MIAQLLSLFGFVPAFGLTALIILAPVLVAFRLVFRFGVETRGKDLRDLDGDTAFRRLRTFVT